MAKGALALLMRMKPKGGSGEDDYGDEEKSEGDDKEKFMSLAQDAFPDEDMTEERVAALKEFVKACYAQED
jgi:hypothetical protein